MLTESSVPRWQLRVDPPRAVRCTAAASAAPFALRRRRRLRANVGRGRRARAGVSDAEKPRCEPPRRVRGDSVRPPVCARPAGRRGVAVRLCLLCCRGAAAAFARLPAGRSALRSGLSADAPVSGQYLILANGARGRAGVALIQQAISNPQLFHFGELIDHENIAALDGARAIPVPAHADTLTRSCALRVPQARRACQCSTIRLLPPCLSCLSCSCVLKDPRRALPWAAPWQREACRWAGPVLRAHAVSVW